MIHSDIFERFVKDALIVMVQALMETPCRPPQSMPCPRRHASRNTRGSSCSRISSA